MSNMIRMQQLQKSFKLQQQTIPIIHVAEWTVRQGERMALLGPSGSGKSTLLHLIGGVIAADQGILEVAGQVISGRTEGERDQFRAGTVGYIFQDFHLIPALTAKQNIELVMQRRQVKSEQNKRIEQWFKRVGLDGHMHKLPSQLSRGQQQRVAIIRALINHPPLVLADEPTGSLDWETASIVMKLLLDICAEHGATLLTVTHDLHLANLYPAAVQIADLNEVMRRQHAAATGGPKR